MKMRKCQYRKPNNELTQLRKKNLLMKVICTRKNQNKRVGIIDMLEFVRDLCIGTLIRTLEKLKIK
jgi:hypothetical protein